MFADTELSAIGDLLQVTLYHNEIKFQHNQFTLKNNRTKSITSIIRFGSGSKGLS